MEINMKKKSQFSKIIKERDGCLDTPNFTKRRKSVDISIFQNLMMGKSSLGQDSPLTEN
jgi:hypothetical protein